LPENSNGRKIMSRCNKGDIFTSTSSMVILVFFYSVSNRGGGMICLSSHKSNLSYGVRSRRCSFQKERKRRQMHHWFCYGKRRCIFCRSRPSRV
jgi:hypothetical protein